MSAQWLTVSGYRLRYNKKGRKENTFEEIRKKEKRRGDLEEEEEDDEEGEEEEEEEEMLRWRIYDRMRKHCKKEENKLE